MNIVTPIDRKFLCQHRNDDAFGTNPGTDFVPYIQGGVIEKLKVVSTYQVSTITQASTFVTISATVVGTEIKLHHPFNDWSNEGFVVGNTVRIEANANNTTETVNNIVGQDMYITDTGFILALGVTDGDLRDDYVIKVTTQPTSLIFKFGIIPNSTSANTYTSILDGQEQLYSINGVLASPALTTLDYLSSESSNLGSVDYTYNGASGAGNYIFEYNVEHIFRLPHYIAEWLTHYINGTIPFNFAGSNSYRYVTELNFGINVNNPNDGKVFTDDYQLGSIGFWGQNFNAGSSNYTLNVPTTYKIGATVVSNPEATSTTTVTAQIKNNSGAFAAGVKGYVYHSKMPDSTDYSNNSTSYEDNFILEGLWNVDGAAATAGTIITGLTVTVNGGDPTLLDVVFNLTYTTAQQDLINSGDYLMLGIYIEDGTLTATNSDRAGVLMGVVTWDKDVDIPGLITSFQPDINTVGSTVITSNYKDWVNNAFEYNFRFDIKKDANSSYAKLKSLSFNAIAYNTSTGDRFDIGSYAFPLGSIPQVKVGGTYYQQINIDTQRILSVPIGDSLREVKLTSIVPGVFAPKQTITGKIGYIVDWQEWIENINVPSVFYDGTKPDEFYNKNKRTSNYSGINGYDIYFVLVAQMEYNSGKFENAVTTSYTLLSDKCSIADFDNDLSAAGWTAVTSLIDSNGDATNDIYNEDVTIKVVFSSPIAGGLLIADVMGTIVLEETGNIGLHHRLHTSLDYQESSNPLKPLVGQTRVKITQDVPGNTITLECLVDGLMLDSTKTYNIYAHLNENK